MTDYRTISLREAEFLPGPVLPAASNERIARALAEYPAGNGIQLKLGFGADPSSTCLREIRSQFRPEFFNRLDGVVTFSPIDSHDMRVGHMP